MLRSYVCVYVYKCTNIVASVVYNVNQYRIEVLRKIWIVNVINISILHMFIAYSMFDYASLT